MHMLEIATGKEIFIIKLFECNMNLTTKVNEIILLTLLMQKKKLLIRDQKIIQNYTSEKEWKILKCILIYRRSSY